MAPSVGTRLLWAQPRGCIFREPSCAQSSLLCPAELEGPSWGFRHWAHSVVGMCSQSRGSSVPSWPSVAWSLCPHLKQGQWREQPKLCQGQERHLGS